MKIVFIDPTNYIINYGLRVLASYILEQGHEVKIVFMPTGGAIDNAYDYPDSVYSDLHDILNDVDMVGLSFVSNYSGQAKHVTRYIKKHFDFPVIWGGIHAMAEPQGSLEYADMVCLGEGEEALLSLIRKMESGEDITTTNNFWFKRDGTIIRNEVGPLVRDLDKYPYPLYGTEYEFIIEAGRIVPLTTEIIKKRTSSSKEYFGLKSDGNYQYLTLSSRGCPHNCSYCCNNLFLKLYKDKKSILRRRSVEHVIGEVLNITERFPFVNFISIFDDDFCAAPTGYILEFAAQYKRHIGLPFKCNVSPSSVTEKKIQALLEAGLVSVEMGLQSASERVNREVYNRRVSNATFIEAARILNRYEQIIPYYDIILDNPFEKTEDMVETIKFLRRLPRPFRCSMFSLTFFPGTELYKKAKEKKMFSDEGKEIYDKKNNAFYADKDPYLKFLLESSLHMHTASFIKRSLFNIMSQDFIFNILSSRPVLFALNRKFFSKLYELATKLYNILKSE